jgi:hypothetical protein
MNRTTLACLAIAVLAAGHARADDITVDPNPFVSVASRAQVQEELRQFLGGGTNPWADDYNPLAPFRSSLSRAEVTAAYIASRDASAAFNGEDSGSSYMARGMVPSQQRDTEIARAQ